MIKFCTFSILEQRFRL